jgi:hypothetical protein
MSDLWPEIKVKSTKAELLHEITYLLYRLQLLGEPEDRIKAYSLKIEEMLERL